MENLPFIPPQSEEDFKPPLLILDDIIIIDAKSWLFLREGSMKDSDEVAFAIKLAKEIERRRAQNNSAIADILELSVKTMIDGADSRTASKALLILKKHWLFGEELYAAYSHSR